MWVGGPVPPGSAAITLGRLVIVRRGAAEDERLMRHELVHVRQWRDLGFIGFLVQYLGSYLRARWNGYGHWDAYRQIPLEMEAEREAAEPLAKGEMAVDAEPTGREPAAEAQLRGDDTALETGPSAG